MNWLQVILWGFVATLVLSTLLAGSQGLGLSRINLPFLLGTMFTPDRDKAKLLGLGVHLINGWIFAFLYAFGFWDIGGSSWWRGALFGAVHATVVLALAFPVLPSLHPRMASEQYGPTITRQLEPPGFLGLHYGYQTPLTILVAHLIYGLILGAFVDIHP